MGDPQAPTIVVNTQSRNLKASPYCAKAKKGSQLIIRLTPPGGKPLNSVEIIPKNSAHTWLSGTNNTSQDLIIIDVPKDLDDSERYYYGIKTDTGCVDPRIDVKD
jgi:hypothetical protein